VASDPSNSSWQRDMVVLYCKLATVAQQTQTGDANDYWRKCLAVLRGMRERNMFIDPPVAELFAQLEQLFGK